MTNEKNSMTMKSSRTYINREHYAHYQKLGGKLTWIDYRYIAAAFIKFTFDAYISGIPSVGSRQECIAKYQAWLVTHCPAGGENVRRVFNSIDEITPYT